jgi:hypothetical protein
MNAIVQGAMRKKLHDHCQGHDRDAFQFNDRWMDQRGMKDGFTPKVMKLVVHCNNAAYIIENLYHMLNKSEEKWFSGTIRVRGYVRGIIFMGDK